MRPPPIVLSEAPSAVTLEGSKIWKPLLVCPNPELARRIRGALAEVGTQEAQLLTEYPSGPAVPALAERSGSNICFVDVTSDRERAFALISDAAAAIPVVAVSPEKDADVILHCLWRGAREFVSEIGPEAMRAVFERLSRGFSSSPAARRPGALYCVVPAKPGCGASTIAVHLAMQMRANGKILVVDADPLTASVGFILKLKSEFHLGDFVRDWKRMDEDLWSRLKVPFSGMDVLLAPETPASKLEIGGALADGMAEFWRERYDATLLDFADPRAAIESGFIPLADRVLLVMTNELAALHAAQRTITLLQLSTAETGRLAIIVNRYTSDAGLKSADLKTVLQAEPFAILNNDYAAVQNALLDGRPVPRSSRFRTSVGALSTKLVGKTAPAEKHAPWYSFLHARAQPKVSTTRI